MSDDKTSGVAWDGRSERRAADRLPIEIWVEESTDRELYFQRGANISAGGIFLERTIPHPKGSLVNLRFTLPGESSPIEVRGEIVNVSDDDADLGMGVRFISLDGDGERRITAHIERALANRTGDLIDGDLIDGDLIDGDLTDEDGARLVEGGAGNESTD